MRASGHSGRVAGVAATSALRGRGGGGIALHESGASRAAGGSCAVLERRTCCRSCRHCAGAPAIPCGLTKVTERFRYSFTKVRDYWTPAANNLYWTPAAKNLYWTPAAKNIYWTPAAKNLYWTPAAKNLRRGARLFSARASFAPESGTGDAVFPGAGYAADSGSVKNMIAVSCPSIRSLFASFAPESGT